MTAFVPMLFEQRLKEFMPASEGCLAKQVRGLGQVNFTLPSGGVQDAERSHYSESFRSSGGNTCAVIHEDCVGLE